jgi:hypothetical protein
MRRTAVVTVFLAGVLGADAGAPAVSPATTIRPVEFDAMVQQSAIVVHGRVVKLETVQGSRAAVARRGAADKPSQPPQAAPPPAMPEDSGSGPASDAAGAAGAAISGAAAGVRNTGRMIFTLVTLAPLSVAKGAAGGNIELLVAGGEIDGRGVVVHGMPTFELGGEYVVFLKNAYWDSADPIVGVNQGFFRVVKDPASGQDLLLTAEGDRVLGVEEDRLVLRRGDESAKDEHGATPAPTGPPTPDQAGVTSQMSAEVARYWFSAEPPLTVTQFLGTVRSRVGR